MKPKVSLIIPVYKTEQYLPECLRSVAAQTYGNFETILVDDGSPDRCGVICDEYAAAHENVIVIHQENRGASAARNRGLERANGEWIMFLDSDDWLDDTTLEVMCRKTEQGYDIVSCSFYFSFVNAEKKGLPETIKERAFPASEYREYLYAACIINISAWGHWFPEEMRCGPVMTFPVVKLYRAKLLRENRIFFPAELKNGEDKCFNLMTMAKANGVYMISDPFYHYRKRKTASGGADTAIMAERYRRMYAELRKIVAELRCGEKAEKSVSLDVARVVWGMLFSAAKKRGKDFRESVRSVREFIHDSDIEDALKTVRRDDLPGMKKRAITGMLQRGRIIVPIFFIKAFLMFRGKDRISYD